MNKTQVLIAIQNILIHKLNITEDQITPEAKFTFDLGVDSIDMVEIFMECEVEFGIKINDDEYENLETVQELTENIFSKL